VGKKTRQYATLSDQWGLSLSMLRSMQISEQQPGAVGKYDKNYLWSYKPR